VLNIFLPITGELRPFQRQAFGKYGVICGGLRTLMTGIPKPYDLSKKMSYSVYFVNTIHTTGY